MNHANAKCESLAMAVHDDSQMPPTHRIEHLPDEKDVGSGVRQQPGVPAPIAEAPEFGTAVSRFNTPFPMARA